MKIYDVLIIDGGGCGAAALAAEAARVQLDTLVVTVGDTADRPVYESFETENQGRLAAAGFVADRGLAPAYLPWPEEPNAAESSPWKREEVFTYRAGESYPFGAAEAILKTPRKQGRRFMPALRGFGPQRADGLTVVTLDDQSKIAARIAFQAAHDSPMVNVTTFAALPLKGFSSISSNFKLIDRFGNTWYLLGEAAGGVVEQWWLCGPGERQTARPLDMAELIPFLADLEKYHGIQMEPAGAWRFESQPELSAILASPANLEATGIHGWLQAFGRGAMGYSRRAAAYMLGEVLKNGADFQAAKAMGRIFCQ